MVAQADARMRGEHLARIRRWEEEARSAASAAGLPHPLDPAMPWDHCFKVAASQSAEFWACELDRKAVLYITHLKSAMQLQDDDTGTSLRRTGAPKGGNSGGPGDSGGWGKSVGGPALVKGRRVLGPALRREVLKERGSKVRRRATA